MYYRSGMNKRSVHICRISLVAAFSMGALLWSAALVRADSGAVALAYPLQQVVVDGSLNDWPDAMPRYAIALTGRGHKPFGADDLQAEFRVAYSAADNALYVAVEVRDESSVLGRNGDFDWRYFDGCEVYLQSPGVDSLHVYTLYGDEPHYRRDPDGSSAILPDSTSLIRAQHGAKGHTYEFRIPAEWRLLPGASYGFDVSIADVDADGSKSNVLWAGAAVKRRARANVGDVLLVADPAALGKVHGQLRAHRGATDKVRVRSMGEGTVDIQVGTDERGVFECVVPSGRYAISAVGRDALQIAEVAVVAGEEALIEISQSAVLGKKKTLGEGEIQQLGPGYVQQTWWSLNDSDGLHLSQVGGMVRDAQGQLWLAAGSSGLARYDGYELVVYGAEDGMPPGPLQQILLTDQGTLWLGFYGGGLCALEGEQLNCYTAEDGLVSDVVTALVEDGNGGLWIGTEGGLCRFDGHSFSLVHEKYLPNISIRSLFVDSRENLWVGTEWGGVARFDGEMWTIYSSVDGLASDDVAAIAQDRSGVLWFGGIGRYASRFDGVAFSTLSLNESLANPHITRIHCDRYGDMWFGLRNAGLAHYSHGEVVRYGTREGLAHHGVSALLEDEEGFFWVGFDNGALSRSHQLRFRTYHTTHPDHAGQAAVYALYRDRNNKLWFGGDQGLFYYDEATDAIANAGIGRDLFGAGIMAMGEAGDGSLWLGSHYGGLLRYGRGATVQYHIKDGMPHAEVYAVLPTRAGDVWLGTYGGGASRFDGAKFHNYSDRDGIPAPGVVEALLEDRRGNIWLGAMTALLRYDGRHLTAVREGVGVRALLEDSKGNLWFGSDALYRYDGANTHSYTGADDPNWSAIECIYEDRDGHLWIGTRSGLWRFDGAVFRQLTRRDGLAHDLVYDITQDRTGDMWFATSGGITRYRPGKVKPQIAITDIVADMRMGPVEGVEIPLSQDYLAFEFSARSFNAPRGEMLYRYRLRGYDEQWRQTRQERAEYAHLPYGSYLFEVVAVDRELNYSPLPASVRVRVHLPYEQIAAWTGSGLVLLLCLLMANGAFKRRQQQRRELQERNELLQEANARLREADQLKSDFVSHVSHELRTPLALMRGSVDNLLDGVVGVANEKQNRYLQRLRSNADHLTTLVDDLLDLSRIEAGYVELERRRVDMGHIAQVVVERLRPLAEEKELVVKCTKVATSALVRGDELRLHQVVANLLGNAIKYTQNGGWVGVEIAVEEAEIRVAVRDNGPGIPAGELDLIFDKFYQAQRGVRGVGIGLSVARYLVEMHGGRIWAESEEGRGSAFLFALVRDVEHAD
jgi:signal transduction histidine kinase/ligand-binding sensor domain-containing protein